MKFRVEMLGEFKIINSQENISIQHLSKQMINLLEILIFNHNSSVSKEKLIEFLWQKSRNPKSAIKFSVFRLRSLLEEIIPLEASPLIITTPLGYALNPHVDWNIDVHDFEAIYKGLNSDELTLIEAQNLAKKLILIYKGPFLVRTDLFWVNQLRGYYQQRYFQCIYLLCELYLTHGKNEAVLDLVQQATFIDRYNEEIHCYYLRALYSMNEKVKLQQYYQQILSMFQKKSISVIKIKNTYDEMMQGQVLNFSLSDIDESVETHGALLCSNEEFRFLYQRELRMKEREKDRMFLLTFSINAENDIQAMERLKKEIMLLLRKSDILTQKNCHEWVAMSNCASEENAVKIAERVIMKFIQDNDSKIAQMSYEVCKI